MNERSNGADQADQAGGEERDRGDPGLPVEQRGDEQQQDEQGDEECGHGGAEDGEAQDPAAAV